MPSLRIQRQVVLGLAYKGLRVDAGYRADLLVEEQVIVELKSVDRIEPIHEAQLLTYLRLADKPGGLIINFNVVRLRDGIVRRALTNPVRRTNASAALRGPPR